MEKYFHFDRNKSLQELDGQVWGEPVYNSHLVITSHQLRIKPVEMLSAEELRIMIGQNICLEFLVPLAIELLNDNIFTEGDFGSGDLINSLLKADKGFWNNNTDYKNDLENLIKENIEDLSKKLKMFQLACM